MPLIELDNDEISGLIDAVRDRMEKLDNLCINESLRDSLQIDMKILLNAEESLLKNYKE